MNYTRVALAALGATVAYFAAGFALFTLPAMRNEFAKYPAIYRSQEAIKSVFPMGMLATFLGIVALVLLYARSVDGAAGLTGGVRFGALVAFFYLCTFVLHNHVNLRIGWELTLRQSFAYFLEWLLVGMVIGLIYRPASLR